MSQTSLVDESTMLAVVSDKYGPPDVLELKQVKRPEPKDHEVLVKVYATTVNRTDTALARAVPFLIGRLMSGLLKPREPIFGSEFAGEIVAFGDAVTAFNIGDQVFGFNGNGFGSHAQYMTISAEGTLVTIPKGVTYEKAAASTEGAFYGYNFINKVNLKKGSQVLVNGATGGIGSATVQLLKHMGADVTAVCQGKHRELVTSLGASKVIDYTTEDFTKMDHTFDFVFDSVGKSSFGACRPLLKPKGIYISSELGAMAQNIFLPLITPLFAGKKVLFPLPLDCKGCLLLFQKLLEEGQFDPVIDRSYPLEQIVEAYQYVEQGQKIGNVVITVGH